MMKIVNDSGFGIGTKILNDGGVDICSELAVESIEIGVISPNEINRATVILALIKIEIDVHTINWVTKNPLTGTFDKVSSITFDNGDKTVFTDEGNVKFYKNNGVERFAPLSNGRTFKAKSAPMS